MTPTPGETFLAGGWGDINDAAAYAKCSTVTISREIRRGRLSAYRVGGRKLIRLKREHVDAWMVRQAEPVLYRRVR